MPSESEILYRGTAAGTPESRPSQSRCQWCHSITSPAEGRKCIDCRIDGEMGRTERLLADVDKVAKLTAASTLCLADRHDECDGHWARTHDCACGCHAEAA